MFLSKLAEWSGLFDILAPDKKTSESPPSQASRGRSNDKSTKNGDRTSTGDTTEKDIKHHRLRSQQDAERSAEMHGVFAKKQRVSYHNKAQDTHHSAFVVGVHFDDGPDRPYYTIRYSKKEVITGEDNAENEKITEIEKQTQSDRLTRVPWDEEESWKILQRS